MRNAHATSELILKAAMDEFSAFGIAGARIERIAITAGFNKTLTARLSYTSSPNAKSTAASA
jgi:hypothetical protein